MRWIDMASYIAINTNKKNIKCVADLDNFKNSNKISEIVHKASHPIFSEEGLKTYKKNINLQKALFQIFNETNNALNKKILLALSNGLQVIYCVGESLEERESNNTLSVITEQLNDGLNGVSVTPDGAQLIIAYEPVWAIGTGKVATPEQAQDVHHFIRKQLALIWNKDTANNTRIQYGGSVKPSNFDAIIEQPDIDGALVGGASLIAKDFIDIVNTSKQMIITH